jgi:hypothetical protein
MSLWWTDAACIKGLESLWTIFFIVMWLMPFGLPLRFVKPIFFLLLLVRYFFFCIFYVYLGAPYAFKDMCRLLVKKIIWNVSGIMEIFQDLFVLSWNYLKLCEMPNKFYFLYHA